MCDSQEHTGRISADRIPKHLQIINLRCTKFYADGRIILRWIFTKWEGVVGTGWSWLKIGTGGRHL